MKPFNLLFVLSRGVVVSVWDLFIIFFGEHNSMPSVKVRDNEPFDFALKRFKRMCEKAGVLAESRKRQYYEKPTQERKRKKAAAVKRQERRVRSESIPTRKY